jgi:hypothetical protein
MRKRDATFCVTSDFFHQILSTVCYERTCTELTRRIQPGDLLFNHREFFARILKVPAIHDA